MAGISPALWGLPVVKTTTERDARFPDPSLNQRVHNLQTGALERWNGSSWVTDFLNTGASTGTPALLVNDVQILALPQSINLLGDGVSGVADGAQAKVTIRIPAAKNAAGTTIVAAPTAYKFQGTGVSLAADGTDAVATITAGGGVALTQDGAPVGTTVGTLDLIDNFAVTANGLVDEVRFRGVSEGVLPMGGTGGVGLVDGPRISVGRVIAPGVLPGGAVAECLIEQLAGLADNDPVSAWGTFAAGNAATYKTASAYDGDPYVQFDGAADYLDTILGGNSVGGNVMMLMVLLPTWPDSGTPTPISLSVAGENQSQSGNRPLVDLSASGSRFVLSYQGSSVPAQGSPNGTGDFSTRPVVFGYHVRQVPTMTTTVARVRLRTPKFDWTFRANTANTTFGRIRLGARFGNFANPGDYAKFECRYAGVWNTALTDDDFDAAVRYLQATYNAQ